MLGRSTAWCRAPSGSAARPGREHSSSSTTARSRCSTTPSGSECVGPGRRRVRTGCGACSTTRSWAPSRRRRLCSCAPASPSSSACGSCSAPTGSWPDARRSFRPGPVLGWLTRCRAQASSPRSRWSASSRPSLVVARRWPRAAFAVAWLCYSRPRRPPREPGQGHAQRRAPAWVRPRCRLRRPRPPTTAPDARYGWPIRPAILVVLAVYFFAGYCKLDAASGSSWVVGDNMGWIMRWGPSIGSSPWQSLATEWVGDIGRGASAAFILGVESPFPSVFWLRRRGLVGRRRRCT